MRSRGTHTDRQASTKQRRAHAPTEPVARDSLSGEPHTSPPGDQHRPPGQRATRSGRNSRRCGFII
eukprot:6498428-Prymnesium_polylepis.1